MIPLTVTLATATTLTILVRVQELEYQRHVPSAQPSESALHLMIGTNQWPEYASLHWSSRWNGEGFDCKQGRGSGSVDSRRVYILFGWDEAPGRA